MTHLIARTLFATACTLAAVASAAAPPQSIPQVRASAALSPPAGGEATAAVLVSHRVLMAASVAGLVATRADGSDTTVAQAGRFVGLDATRDPAGAGFVVVAADGNDNTLRLFRLLDDKLLEVDSRRIPLGFAVENVCLARNVTDGALHAFALGDEGHVAQWQLFAAGDKLDAAWVRTISLPSGATQCAADANGTLYVAEENVGVWRFNVDPESDLKPALVDAHGLGHLGKKTTGLAHYSDGGSNQWLLAANESDGLIDVYDLAAKSAWLGALRVTRADDGGAIEEPGNLDADPLQLGTRLPHGALVVADKDGSNRFQLVSMDAIAQALGKTLGTPNAGAASTATRFPHLTPRLETGPVAGFGDAADDPAIWANPEDPARSLIVATDKKSGMVVYDMQGKQLDYRPDGRMNNTDLRGDFSLGGEKIVLVAASDRSHKSIALYRLDTRNGTLHDVADGVQATGLADPYGLCMYRSARDGATYVFINSPEGTMRQWRLKDNGAGRVRAEQVREFHFPSQAEGCVADDASGTLLVNEEDVAMWRMGAEPEAGDQRTAIARIDANPKLAADLEGVGIYHLGDGRGYIVASSQGNDSYAVYRLEGDRAYLGSFRVVADPARGIDGISQTDGLDISSQDLGPGFEHGAMIAQDGRNVMPEARQNYKYVAWTDIARALGLELRRQPRDSTPASGPVPASGTLHR